MSHSQQFIGYVYHDSPNIRYQPRYRICPFCKGRMGMEIGGDGRSVIWRCRTRGCKQVLRRRR